MRLLEFYLERGFSLAECERGLSAALGVPIAIEDHYGENSKSEVFGVLRTNERGFKSHLVIHRIPNELGDDEVLAQIAERFNCRLLICDLPTPNPYLCRVFADGAWETRSLSAEHLDEHDEVVVNDSPSGQQNPRG